MSKPKNILEPPLNTSPKQKSELSPKSTPQSEEEKLQDYFSEIRRQAQEADQYYQKRFKTE